MRCIILYQYQPKSTLSPEPRLRYFSQSDREGEPTRAKATVTFLTCDETGTTVVAAKKHISPAGLYA